MGQPGRQYSAGNGYRYGFNGKENDNEVKGEGNQQDYGMRIYDPRLGRFLTVDPITSNYPELTPYQFASNRPIDGMDQDGLEWFYSNDIFSSGWKVSIMVKPPPIMATDTYKQEYYNKVGYFTAAQKDAIQQGIESKQNMRERIEAARKYNEGMRAYMSVQAMNNPIYLAYKLSPASTLVDAYESFSSGDTWGGTLNIALSFGGFSELKSLGLGKFSTASDFYDITKVAGTSISDIWKVSNNFLRGTLIENKLAQTIYKGYEHLGSTVSKFFKTIDYYKEGLGVSLKSVNATKNFDFKNIIKNIDDLADAKAAGAIRSGGSERVITDVRLDIAIPKGYDRKVLNKVQKYATKKGVKTNIFVAD